MQDFAFYYPPINERDLGRGCYLTSIGRGRHAAGSPYPAGGHPQDYAFEPSRGRVFPDFALVRISEGQGWFENRRDRPPEPVQPGDFFCLTPGSWHSYAPDPETGWTEAWVCFNGDYPHRLHRNAEWPEHAHLVRPKPDDGFAARFDNILQALEPSDRGSTLGSGLRCLALFAEVAGLDPTDEKPIPGDRGDESALCARARGHLLENLHRQVDLDTLAAHLGVTRRTLERRFGEETGQSPAAFLAAARVERAIGLIENTDMPLKAIAFACGFGSPHRMIYNFRRHKGMPPSGFKRTIASYRAERSPLGELRTVKSAHSKPKG